ncbi:restriction endonuclease subunit S [Escherichia coli]|jgi:type I restriction enzyme S subunit|uniref:restriction endonuclease subunit S n=1 Tax=Enterobacteriaceae TaxID=543 RepID=UPI00063C557E|nr:MULTISPECIES: restriction endonuclease subunit S [Enterobacteriaceae]EFK3481843.1 restriction endonuclease subunit S [Escherichia coli]ELM7985732.1 restriction endonuclease subunit S [Escherichia coli]ELM8042982.1 restriction endonuclease subunit S [Escherichia coli]KLF98966.1 restriction endonuclease subunit S [Enterobacter hormaechei subsp. oharae]MCK6983616.1 restriction endonuclease subunit S [Enterobacter roggenkampii]
MTFKNVVKLGDFVTIKHGYAFPGKFITSQETKKILVTPGNFNIGGGFKSSKFKYYSGETYPEQYRFNGGELIVTMTDLSKETDTLGYAALVPNDNNIYLHNQRVGLVQILNNDLDKMYLYWKMRTREYQEFIANSASGTSVMHTSPKKICEYEFLLPTKLEQKAIASVLSSLDEKIDLLHHQNKTLELMAETMFRQWFILDETGASVNLEQIIDFNPKRTLTKSQDATYLDMAGLSTVIFRANGYYRRPFSSGTKFTKRDTLLARITPCLENGKAAYIDFLDDNETGWGSTEFIVMRPKKEIHPFISYIMCRNPDFKEYAESCMEGSTGRQRVNLDHLKKFNVNLPTEASLRIINELLDSFEIKLINNSKQIDSLEKLRDTLLPKLMSGEVRVQYAEEAIASVA